MLIQGQIIYLLDNERGILLKSMPTPHAGRFLLLLLPRLLYYTLIFYRLL